MQARIGKPVIYKRWDRTALIVESDIIHALSTFDIIHLRLLINYVHIFVQGLKYLFILFLGWAGTEFFGIQALYSRSKQHRMIDKRSGAFGEVRIVAENHRVRGKPTPVIWD